jgi:5-methyltetrahydrofolate--homocysteine methyltransferase
MTASFEALKQAIIEGDVGTALPTVEQMLADGEQASAILDQGLLPAMDVVGSRMRAGECFIPEVLLSARAMRGCLETLKPHLEEGESGTRGTVVIGTVEGDVHDIGKNLVAMMLEGAGFTVHNLGTGISPAAFVAAAKEHAADIVCMSALLTTTMPKMAATIDALEAAGMRGQVKVLVGGAPVTQSYADEIGADGTGGNAALAVDRSKQLLS